MLYAILCYHDETPSVLTREQDAAVMKKLAVVQDADRKDGSDPWRGCSRRHRHYLRCADDPPVVIDGPYAETKEQLLLLRRGLQDLDEALDVARSGAANPGGAYEIARRHVPAGTPEMTDTAWIDPPAPASQAARCYATSATRHRRGSFQNACLRALKSWPQNGPPCDPANVAGHGRAQCRDR
jgi:hypothetical protein